MMIIYSPVITPRLRFTGDLISYELTGQPPVYTSDPVEFRNFGGIRINYSESSISDGYRIKPAGLMGETGVRKHDPVISAWKDQIVLFPVAGDHPFDIFSASFFLLTRYEEWLPYTPDEYGRFSFRDSIAWRGKFLDQPLVDKWIVELGAALQKSFPDLSLKEKKFEFLPTYDIDEAWSYRNKPPFISLGGMVRDLVRGKWERVRLRGQVRKGTAADPFDSFDWMDRVHEDFGLSPIYFFLVAKNRGRYDKNPNPAKPEFRELVSSHASRYPIGIHPSWQSVDRGSWQEEISLLEEISGTQITGSRQHFIRFHLPQTYRRLISAGIRDEYSMGYGSVNGFRASASFSFHWYDLEKEEQTPLRVHPFCFMDANCFFEQKQSPLDAEQEMRSYYDRIKAVNGRFISIWHNTFLGTDPLFSGWREAYLNFLKGIHSSK